MFFYVLEKEYFGNTILNYLNCLALIFIGALAVRCLRVYLIRSLRKWAEKTETTIDDLLVGILQRILLPMAYLAMVLLAVNCLHLPPLLRRVVDVIGMAVILTMTVHFTTLLIGYGFNYYWARRGKDINLQRSLKGILRVIKILIWSIAVIFFLDNLGFKISAVIAGLGIGGVAIALAAQAVLGDLFSYFAIIFDRPFEIGDFVIVGDYLGTVDYIGIKTTRIRSLGGEQIVFSNTDLTNSRVRNYKRMGQRRVVFKLGVTYQTALEQLKMIPGIIEGIIKGLKDVAFDRAHFFSYGDFSLIIEVVYYIVGSDYNKYMDIQQEINFAIKKEFEARGIEFAYPTQTLFVEKSKRNRSTNEDE